MYPLEAEMMVEPGISTVSSSASELEASHRLQNISEGFKNNGNVWFMWTMGKGRSARNVDSRGME